jgi:Flp pilus assembly protein TadD
VVDDVVVGVVDVMPTILELLGIPIPTGLDGLSLLHCRESPGRMIYMETLAAYMESGWAPLYGLRRHQDKYILAPRPEYYDLRNDPRETQNLFGGSSRQAATAVAELAQAMTRRTAESPALETIAAAAVPLDPEARRRLESLGYVSGAAPEADADQPDPKDMMPLWNRYLEIKKLADAGQFEEALPRIKELLTVAPKDRMILRKLAQVYLRMGREPEAEEILRRCIALRPNSNVFLLLGQIMINDGRFSEAQEMLDSAAALEPLHGGVLIARGDMLALKGQFAEAIARYEEAIRVDPYRATGLAMDRIARIRSEPARVP